eukprot:TRINITY_DN4492_c0_g1_i1.p1 TRINITY_DN4492_c0_g1~~TRINITY_DN4492_c0_g1_i1.p1  ORF type:complete len:316 (+),score=58.62 TRINITY_DN4492_c0_g1_i1:131-949(+)
MRERQRWQDRYEFTDEEIEDEMKSESEWVEKWREFKTNMRYYMNIFEEHDNISSRRRRDTLLLWREPIVLKAILGIVILLTGVYNQFTTTKLFKKMNYFTMMGGGADWPTHYITLKEIHEGRRSINEVVKTWETVRETHQRDWLLPLLTSEVIMKFALNPQVFQGKNPNEAIINKLVDDLAFIESNISTMSAEIAYHLHNLLVGDVEWPGPRPNEAVILEIKNCIDGMSNFKIHPELRSRLAEAKEKKTTYFGGTGYFESTQQELQNKVAGV